ncbi:ACP phosphodiesterase [Zhongshania sp.]|uniref:acyl carrier protein phosphodiesterase n=1 Tax=Zhongshania sp. TaxID=1971902 RepID=UPI0039E2E48A
MNYLAHFHLAHQLASRTGLDQQGLLIGGLLGDFVKGPLQGNYPAAWEIGIRLHRRIDALTDSHALVSNCLAILPTDYRRYGGIMLDVCFDHCLSLRWNELHASPIKSFTQDCYQHVLLNKGDYPRAAARQIHFLAEYDVLSKMDSWDNIEAMLARIAKRIPRENPLSYCGAELALRLPFIEQQFLSLYPALQEQLFEEFSSVSTP